MGATGIPGGLHGETPTAYLTRELTFLAGDRSRTVLATRTCPGSDYRHVLYAATLVTDAATGETVTEAVVIQYETIRRDGQPEFVFRTESEHVGPCPRQCPTAILDMLTPLPPPPADGTHDPHASARQWRQDCRTNAARAATAQPRPGDRIVFSAPWTLSDRTQETTFTAEHSSTNSRALRFRSSTTGRLCTLRNWRRHPHRIEPRPATPAAKTTPTPSLQFALL